MRHFEITKCSLMVNTLTKVNKEAEVVICRFVLKLNYGLHIFQSWDLVQQTQNYLKLLLHIINSDGKLLCLRTSFSNCTTGIMCLNSFGWLSGVLWPVVPLQMRMVYWCTVYQAGTGHPSLCPCSDSPCGRWVSVPLPRYTCLHFITLFTTQR